MERLQAFREEVRMVAFARAYGVRNKQYHINNVIDLLKEMDEKDKSIAMCMIKERGIEKELGLL